MRLYNFGFERDMQVVTSTSDPSIATCEYLYRHPDNFTFFTNITEDKPYVVEYVQNGLVEKDLIWQVAVACFRSATGSLPFCLSTPDLLTKADFR